MKLNQFALLYITFILFDLSIFAQQHISMYDCWKAAIANNSITNNYKILKNIEKNNILNITNSYYPNITINGQATYQSGNIIFNIPYPDFTQQPISFLVRKIESPREQFKLYIEAQQPIYLGNRKKNTIELEYLNTKTDILKNDIELRNLIEQVSNLYFNLLLLQQRVVILQNTDTILKERARVIQAAVRSGMLNPNDTTIIAIEILKNNQKLIEQKLLISSLWYQMSELTGISNHIDSINFLFPNFIITDTIFNKEYELQLLDCQSEKTKQLEKKKSSENQPFIFAFTQGGIARPAFNMLSNKTEPYYLIGLSLKWRIFDWNNNYINRQQLVLQQKIIENQKQTFEQKNRILRTQQRIKILQIENVLKTDSLIYQLRKASTLNAAKRLERGTISTTDYINELLAENQTLLQLKYDYIQLIQEKLNYLLLLGYDEKYITDIQKPL